jgi:ubiquinone/menaquinone biosynthesis C-methylase UbiE
MDYQEYLDLLPDEESGPWKSESSLAGKAIKENLPAEPSIVLFIGAGTGKFACAVGALGHKVMAMELSREQFNIAQARVKENGLGLKVIPIWEEYGKLKFDDGTFDLVVAERGVLSFVENPEKISAELARVTKPNGKIIATFFLKPVDARVRMLRFDEGKMARLFPGMKYSKAENSGAICLTFNKL